jgi:hypothetical protein
MKINQKILSLPPYISTSWKNIASLFLEDKGGTSMLVIELYNGSRVEIPGLQQSIIETIFEAHTKYLEEEASKPIDLPIRREELAGGLPFRIGSGGGIEALGSAMQHNPEQKEAPDLPPEILTRITGVAKVLGLDDPHALPKPEPHCNCMHCQIARALQAQHGHDENLDEDVKSEELKFRVWDIKQTNEKLYSVSNPLDEKECYNVYLGTPLGCTCGQKNCEHIRAVLNS